jgi:xylan 1,4-beta-xylosidase
MLGRLAGDWVATSSSQGIPLETIMADGVRGPADVNAVATRDGGGLSILLWHYHDDDTEGPHAAVTIEVEGCPRGEIGLTHFRMDRDHSNAFAVWKAMGSPQIVADGQLTRLSAASELAVIATEKLHRADNAALRLTDLLPRQGVSLIRLDW